MNSTDNHQPLQVTDKDTATSYLSEEETRKILTPFAFKIDKSLFGIALAAPRKRAIAILIDLFLIAMLSDTPGELLAIVIAITLFRLGSKKRAQQRGKVKGAKRRAMLRFLAAFIVFVILVDTLPEFFSGFSDKGSDANQHVPENVIVPTKELSITETIGLSAFTASTISTISESDCQSLPCWQKELSPKVEDVKDFELDVKTINGTLLAMATATDLPEPEQDALHQHLMNLYQNKAEPIENDNLKGDVLVDNVATNVKAIKDPSRPTDTKIKEAGKEEKKSDKQGFSIIKWIDGMIDEMGLGLGWAAFYFTAFTALWNGQTPGKKVMGIRVQQLDGTPLSMWDSFGRYGGYVAGIATGLLGFMQIYWDPNRQAIHDRISATIVIDVKKANRDWSSQIKQENGE